MITLYKNVDLGDLIDITTKGILPMDKCGNDSWDSGKRAKNRTDVVYLFAPINPQEKNSFVNYGLALLQVSVPEQAVKETELKNGDVHYGKYKEYIADEVRPECITNIYVPKLFKERIEEYDKLSKLLPSCPVTWCDIELSEWNGPFTSERLKLFTKTAPIHTSQLNYFRGVDDNGWMIDVNEDRIVYKIG